MTIALDLADIRLATPPRKRQRGGEWDWWTDLSFGTQQAARRHMVADGMGPDELAGVLGCEIDEACRRWLEMIGLESVTGQLRAKSIAESDRPETELYAMGDLLGPADIAEMLDVQPGTIRQWLLRDLLPAPVYVNRSGRVRLWAYDDIDRWARATGRRVEVTEPEF